MIIMDAIFRVKLDAPIDVFIPANGVKEYFDKPSMLFCADKVPRPRRGHEELARLPSAPCL